MSRFFLIGFMGAGKTTLGRRVAERMGLPFFDLDHRIESAAGMSVAEIFSARGEPEFRRLESEALKELVSAETSGVIATGGGAFTLEENRRLMAASGIAIWLDVPTEELFRRVPEEGSRPLWSSRDEVHDLHERRRADYGLAQHRLDLGGAGIDEAAERLERLLADHQKGS